MVLRGACRSLERVSSATLTIVVSRTAMISPRVATAPTTSVGRSSPPDRRCTLISRARGIHPSSWSQAALSSARGGVLAVLPARYGDLLESRPQADDRAGSSGQHSGMSWLRNRRSALADEFIDSYVCWREACEDVRSAYGRWAGCQPQRRSLGFATYCAALEREERAATIHSEWAERLGAVARRGRT